MNTRILKHLAVFLTYSVVGFGVCSYLLNRVPDTRIFVALILSGVFFTVLAGVIQKLRKGR